MLKNYTKTNMIKVQFLIKFRIMHSYITYLIFIFLFEVDIIVAFKLITPNF